MIEVKNLCFSYGSQQVLREISFHLEAGQILTLLGPNGIGKSTLLEILVWALAPTSGEVLLQGENITGLTPKQIARKVAYVPQQLRPAFNFSVLEVVTMARTGRLGYFASPSAKDRQIANECLQAMGIASLAGKGYNQISGGERQLCSLAAALAQDAEMIVLDEPAAHLDPAHAHHLLTSLRTLNAQFGNTIVLSTHDPNHALLLGGKVLGLRQGQVAAFGPVQQVLTEQLLKRLYECPFALAPIAGRTVAVVSD